MRWSVPGDDARIEEDGTITLLGRGSVSINTGGEKVYPEEVESALKADPDVIDAIVVGVPDARWGERVVALIEPRAGHTIDPAEVDRSVRDHVAGLQGARATSSSSTRSSGRRRASPTTAGARRPRSAGSPSRADARTRALAMNRLASETSPYLRQHADNPVDWYPWGEEAFARAVAEDKPILLSVGYSACHWCHVMAHESFEDAEVAAVMNDRFVNVKVDREERPDVDAIYMDAVQALTGHGGWPMTVFLTPDGRPFFGGTYFPQADRQGMPGFSASWTRSPTSGATSATTCSTRPSS